MKILHIWDQAGTACTIAKYQRRLGHEVQVIKQERHDEYGFLKFYNETFLDMDGKEFDDFAVDLSKHFDIIHVHSIHDIAQLVKTLYPDKKVFIHYHGSDLRTNPINTECNKIVDGIFYATPDLRIILPERAKYIPTIVDTEVFYPGTIGKGEFTAKDVHNILYKDIPKMYSMFDTFRDGKIVCGKEYQTISKTAYECLALGLKVIDWQGHIHEGLPDIHKPNNVVNLLEKYYAV